MGDGVEEQSDAGSKLQSTIGCREQRVVVLRIQDVGQVGESWTIASQMLLSSVWNTGSYYWQRPVVMRKVV